MEGKNRMTKTVSIAGKEYPAPSVDNMKRKEARKMSALMVEIQKETPDLDSLWELVGTLIPSLPKPVLDDLTVGECQQILVDAEVIASDSAVTEAVSLGE